MPPTVVVERAFELPLPPAEAWPLVSDTNRLNRAMGLPAVEGSPGADGGRRVTARLFGIAVTWTERPFEWVAPRYYRVRRDFLSGPLACVEGGISLTASPGGCRVLVHAELSPRNAAGALAARALGWNLARAMERVLRPLALQPSIAGLPRRARPSVDAALLRRRLADLPADIAASPAAGLLIELLKTGLDEEVAGMRPFELADRWGLGRLDTLRACLHAVKAGLLQLQWRPICPHCLGGDPQPGLSSLGPQARCRSCQADFEVKLDESLELRFNADPALRSAAGGVFCVGNPAQTPFVLAQARIEPGAWRRLELAWPAKSLILRDLARKRAIRLRPDGASGELRVDLACAGEELSFRPGPGALQARAGVPTLLRLESEPWTESAAKASVVTALQDFRDLFSSEVVSPGVELSVGRVTLMFSDLKDSTRLYQRVGDAPAYALVRDHFDLIVEAVRQRGGAVVKTIGDAVMAVFPRASDGLQSALDIQLGVVDFNRRAGANRAIVLKLGLHEGAAIVINAGGVLDYFGTTVNVAARVQNESIGGDIVVTQRVLEDPAAAKLMAASGWAGESFTIELKGLRGPYQLSRLTLQGTLQRA